MNVAMAPREEAATQPDGEKEELKDKLTISTRFPPGPAST